MNKNIRSSYYLIEWLFHLFPHGFLLIKDDPMHDVIIMCVFYRRILLRKKDL